MTEEKIKKYIGKIKSHSLEKAIYFVAGFSMAINVEDIIKNKSEIYDNIASFALLTLVYTAMNYKRNAQLSKNNLHSYDN